MMIRYFVAFVLWLFLVPVASAQVYHWGEYVSGAPTPTAVKGTEGAVRVLSSNSFGLALTASGQVLTFGKGNVGQLGNGKGTSSESAVHPSFPEGTVLAAIGENENAGFAVEESTGQVWSWGASGGSDDGLCTNGATEVPKKIAGLTEVKAVAGGAHHVLFLMDNGTVKGCGENKDGQLGLPKGTKVVATPTTISGLEHIVEVSAGDLSSCARSETGKVYCFGLNNHGQVGSGSHAKEVFAATEVKLSGPASEVSCGGDQSENGSTLALVEGVPYGWGDDSAGQLGDGGTTDRYAPIVSSDLTMLGVTQVAAAGSTGGAVTESGAIYTFGEGPIGNGTELAATPVMVDSEAIQLSGTAGNFLDLH